MKILYYDIWTKGIRCFLPFEKELKKQGHETLLVHTSSYKNIPYKKQEIIEGLLCRDVTFYHTNFIFKILKKEKPDLLIALNTSYLWDRANVLACRELNIKTLFLMHGDFSLGEDLDKAIKLLQPRNKLSNKKDKALLYLFKVIPNYIYSLHKNRKSTVFSKQTYQVIKSYVKDQYQAMVKPVHTSDLIHDKCLVYSKKYIDYYHKKLGYPKKNIIVVGNPDYDIFLKRVRENDFDKTTYLPKEVLRMLENGKYVLYIENGFPEAKIAGWDNAYRNEHLNKIAARIKKEGYSMVVKLHPHSKIETFKLNDKKNVLVIKEIDLYALVKHASFCIVHASTTNEIPILLNKALVYPKFGRSNNTLDFYKNSKTINYWNNIDDELPIEINEKNRVKYIDENIMVNEKNNSAQMIIREIEALKC